MFPRPVRCTSGATRTTCQSISSSATPCCRRQSTHRAVGPPDPATWRPTSHTCCLHVGCVRAAAEGPPAAALRAARIPSRDGPLHGVGVGRAPPVAAVHRYGLQLRRPRADVLVLLPRLPRQDRLVETVSSWMNARTRACDTDARINLVDFSQVHHRDADYSVRLVRSRLFRHAGHDGARL